MSNGSGLALPIGVLIYFGSAAVLVIQGSVLIDALIWAMPVGLIAVILIAIASGERL